MTAAAVTQYVHSRAFAGLMLAIAFAGIAFTFFSGDYLEITGDQGFVVPSADEWLRNSWLSFAAALACNAVVVVMAAFLERLYNVLRSVTALPLALIGVFQLATPELCVQFYTGTLLAVLMVGCLMVLFSCYRTPGLTRRIFFIFLILSAGCATQYCYAFYLPVFLLGCGQMRVFNGRTLVAALLGLITPWWIMGATGLLTAETLHMPEFVSVFAMLNSQSAAHLLITVGITALLLVGCYVMNVFKTIAYNARTRAFSGALATLSLVTLLGTLLDYHNLISYLPLLNFCAAYEVAGYFASHRGERTGGAVICIVITYIILFLCQIRL